MLSTLLRFALALLLCTLPLTSQVPIDLSQAKEFKVVWKKPNFPQAISFPPWYIPNLCGEPSFDVLMAGGYVWTTRPMIDTTINYRHTYRGNMMLDYDGVPPLEYINVNGYINQCDGGSDPTRSHIVDSIDANCWGGAYTWLNA